MNIAGGVAESAGAAKGEAFKGQEAATAARYGKIAAAETDTNIREELKTTVANIRAIRASAGIDPDSPTTAAILANEGRISERERRIRVGNIMAQAASDKRAAQFYKSAAPNTFLYGTLGAFGSGFTSLASYYKPQPSGS